MATQNLSQSIDSTREYRLRELATLLGVPKSRVLDTLLSGDVKLLAEAVTKPAEAERQLQTIEVLDQGRIIGEAVVRYLEARDQIMNKG